MCFKIKPYSQGWENRYVYKTVFGSVMGENIWMSEIFSFYYRLGRTYTLSEEQLQTTLEVTGQARCGFYVYNSIATAKKHMPLNTTAVILCLEVKPEDFLYEDETERMATYKRVRVIGEM
jgi:hypothetical protein